MKTIHLLCSLIVIVFLTVTLGGIKPPPKPVSAATSNIQAAQAPEKSEPVNIAPTPEKPQEQAETKPSVEKKPEPIQLTDHQNYMQQAGIPSSDWPAVEDVISKESGWCATKWEGEYGACPAYHGVPESGGYGLCQSTPAHKMASIDADWATNPVKQLQWCHQYAQGYGGWWPAKKFRDCLGSCYSPRTNTTPYKKTTWF